jgi:hypothetical protein
MFRFTSTLFGVFLLLALAPAYGQDFQKGMEAANSGDYATALKELRPLAEQGHADAQSNLGYMYANGQGVPQDYVEAARWYRLAAEQGEAWAQYSLGNMYNNGEGVAQNYAEAARWYRLAAEQGDDESLAKAQAAEQAAAEQLAAAGTPHDTYPNVVVNAGGLNPAPGYEWASNDPDDFTVIQTQSAGTPHETYPAGTPHETYPNVVYTGKRPGDGDITPAPGYEWASNDPDDFTVIEIGSNSDTSTSSAGTPHDTYPNVVVNAGGLNPAPGYEWASNDPDDFTVILTGSRPAKELVCEGREARYYERAVFVDCSDNRAVIDALGKAWQTLREYPSSNMEYDMEYMCYDPYILAKGQHPSIELIHIAESLFSQCNQALEYVQ